jgi:succinate-acetate transporter protein
MTTATPLVHQPEPDVVTTATQSKSPANPTGDPLVLGLPLISVGAIALGLQLVGYVNLNSNGSPLALILAASGLGLLVATIAGTRLASSPASSPWSNGRALPTAVLGVLATFFLSYGVLVLGLVHNWFGVTPTNVQHTVALFQISWLVVIVFFAIASIRLPLLFTVLFVTFGVVLALLLVATLHTSTTVPSRVAGVLSLIIAVAAGYVFLAVASVASGGQEFPIGRPIGK